MRENFEHALARVLRHEGGFSNHPHDRGGATMRGVTQRVYDSYRDRNGLGRQSVRQITMAEIAEIYHVQYWRAVRADDLPSGVDYCVFDGAVNSGPGQSAKWLQRAVGCPADGIVGEITLDACRMYGDYAGLVDAICDQRMAFLQRLPNWSAFGRGWTSRVAAVRHEASAMVEPAPEEPAPEPHDEPCDPRFDWPPAHPQERWTPKAPPASKPLGRSKTLWSVFFQVISSIGISIGAWLRDPYVVFALVALVIFLALFIGRERILKWVEEKL